MFNPELPLPPKKSEDAMLKKAAAIMSEKEAIQSQLREDAYLHATRPLSEDSQARIKNHPEINKDVQTYTPELIRNSNLRKTYTQGSGLEATSIIKMGFEGEINGRKVQLDMENTGYSGTVDGKALSAGKAQELYWRYYSLADSGLHGDFSGAAEEELMQRAEARKKLIEDNPTQQAKEEEERWTSGL